MLRLISIDKMNGVDYPWDGPTIEFSLLKNLIMSYVARTRQCRNGHGTWTRAKFLKYT